MQRVEAKIKKLDEKKIKDEEVVNSEEKSHPNKKKKSVWKWADKSDAEFTAHMQRKFPTFMLKNFQNIASRYMSLYFDEVELQMIEVYNKKIGACRGVDDECKKLIMKRKEKLKQQAHISKDTMTTSVKAKLSTETFFVSERDEKKNILGHHQC